MRRLNSEATLLWKYTFPFLWFGFLGLFVVITLISMASRQEFNFRFLVVPLIMAGVGYFSMKQRAFALVDEVWDAGDALIAKNKNREERIPLANIVNVDSTRTSNHPRITLTLRQPCAFGKEISFAPPARFFSFSRHPLATELIDRIDRARSKPR